MKEMQKEIKDMSATIQSFKVSLDRQSQYPRRHCLLIHGFPENRNENCWDFKKMGEEIKEVELDRTNYELLRRSNSGYDGKICKIQYKKYNYQK